MRAIHGGLRLGVGVVLAALLAMSGCASGTGSDGGAGGSDGGHFDSGSPPQPDSGPPPVDAGPMMDAPMPMMDAGDPCTGVTCDPFQYCMGGSCLDYPACAGDGSCERPGDVCQNRRCVPGDVDIDGDGVPASMDCDETDPNRYPGNTEICSPIDEDCDGMVDEGDPAVLCESYPGGGTCMDQQLRLPAGHLRSRPQRSRL